MDLFISDWNAFVVVFQTSVLTQKKYLKKQTKN